MTEYSSRILPQHAKLLAASAISPQVAEADGIYSAVRLTDLPLEFQELDGATLPALVFPWHRVNGDEPLYQIRPDRPLHRPDGTEAKYLFAPKAKPVLCVHPGMRERVLDPGQPLLFVEGTKQYLAAVSALAGQPYAAVGIAGCYGWALQGAPVPDMGHLPWSRDVYLGFDADVDSNRNVWEAASALTEVLITFGATSVRYMKVPGIGSAGLDDVLGTVSDRAEVMLRIIGRARPQLPRRPAKRSGTRRLSDPSAKPSHLHTPGRPAETADSDTCDIQGCEATPPTWVKGADILERLVRDLRQRCGLTGEHRNAKLLYLVVVSRVLDSPASAAVKGLSGAGKSYTVECVLMAFPSSAVITMTAMSEHALVYMREPFAHRTLVLYEATALREGREKTEGNQTAMFIRTLLSEGKIVYPTVVKEPETGDLVTKVIEKDGPTNFIVTTTATSLHPENETRMLSLGADDSQQQTTEVMKAIASKKKRSNPGFGDWHALDHWIRYHANHAVRIPYADWLAENIPPVAVRLRRDFATFLALIDAHAILHQAERETSEDGHIIASHDDYLAVRTLVADLMSDAVGSTVKESVRQTVAEVRRLMDEGEVRCGVTVLQLADALGLERSAAQYRAKAAKEAGYLINLEEKPGKPARYAIGAPLPNESSLLPGQIPVEHLHTSHPQRTLTDQKPQVGRGCEGVKGQHGGQDAAHTSRPVPPGDASADGDEFALIQENADWGDWSE